MSYGSFHRSLQKSKWAIALCKRANEQSFFAKEQMSDRSFFALFKRATKRAITLSLYQKIRIQNPNPNCSFFAQKKSDCSFLKWANAQPWLTSQETVIGWNIFDDYIFFVLSRSFYTGENLKLNNIPVQYSQGQFYLTVHRSHSVFSSILSTKEKFQVCCLNYEIKFIRSIEL